MAGRNEALWALIEGRSPGAPITQHLRWKCVHADPDKGTLKVQFDPRPEFVNPFGTIHGGMLSAMLDETMAPCAQLVLDADHFASTLELKTSLLRPAKLGPLFGSARVVHKGRTAAFLEAEIRTPEDVLIATATATFIISAVPGRKFDTGQAQSSGSAS
ncbi:MAG: PaaI family thioesterase [Betaproteobacteria bacterium]|nr:PaaI family thioesterase [Betaproteobacteria bacterium]